MKIKTFTITLGMVAMFVAGGLWKTRQAADTSEQCYLHDHNHDHSSTGAHQGNPSPADDREQVYTCSMHPQVRTTDPDEPCPICGMELIPVPMDDDDLELDGELPQLRLSQRAVALMQVRTWPAERREVELELPLLGHVDFDENTLRDVVVQTPGYIERLEFNFLGQRIGRGDMVAEIYSPDAVSAFRELLLAAERGGGVLTAARSRLLRLGVTEEQIDEVLQTGQVPRTFQVLSPGDGLVRRLDVRAGSQVAEGQPLLQIADLSTVWINLEVYERDLAWLNPGQEFSFNIPAQPGLEFTARLDFIEPELDMQRRTLRARATVDNIDEKLKPGMFVRSRLRVPYTMNGTTPATEAHDHDSHNDHAQHATTPDSQQHDHNHEIEPSGPPQDSQMPLLIPASAPLFMGRRAMVYVQIPDTERPTFEPRKVTLGPRSGNSVVVVAGLQEGELVVVNGQFKIDSELQIRGRPSMMAPEGGAPPAHHDHGSGMDLPDAPDHDHAAPGSEIQQLPATPRFQQSLGRAVAANFSLAAALADDDPAAAQGAAATLLELVPAVSTQEMDEETPAGWLDLAETMEESLNKLVAEEDLNQQRRHFEIFSNALTKAIRTFGVAGLDTPVYQAMCPMIRGRRGYWLQPQQIIANPYHGASMLRCGEVVDVLYDTEND